MDDWELMEQRKAQDERVIQEWAQANGGGNAVRHVRNFVQNVRRDIGVKGVITGVKVKPIRCGLEIEAVYYMEPDPEKDGLPGLHPSTATTSALSADGWAPTEGESTGGVCGRGGGRPFGTGVEQLTDMVPPGAVIYDPSHTGEGPSAPALPTRESTQSHRAW